VDFTLDAVSPPPKRRPPISKGIRMRMYALKMGCAITAVTLTLSGSPVAHADDASFVRDTQALGFIQASQNLISTARSACYFIGFFNRDPDQVSDRIKRYLSVDSDKAHRFLVLAVNEYCPQYISRIGD
jgi:menaquinone-dependent protoporphyrinogen IX oxidase